ncbi:MAG: histidine phosphatase family protein [Kiritimatiellae bacterium]|nr:histidine phosphatase family protein [Kiritimatiellia bacterium]
MKKTPARSKKKDPLTLVLVRHGQAAPTKREPDSADPPLTALGRRQARRVAKRLSSERFDHIYASDLQRALDTAAAIRAFHPKTRFTVDPRIREVLAHHFLKRPDSRKKARRERVKRERLALEQFAAYIWDRHRRGQRILIVCHFDVICTLVPILAGKDPKKTIPVIQYNSAVTVFKTWGLGQGWLELAGCVRHLRAGDRT